MKTKKLLLIIYGIVTVFPSWAIGFCLENDKDVGYFSHTDSVKVFSSAKWHASSNADWLTILTGSGGNQDYCVFHYAANEQGNERSAYITFSNEGLDSWTVYIHQYGNSILIWEYSYYLLADDWYVYQNTQLNKVYAQGSENVYIVGDGGFFAKSTNKAARWQKRFLSNKVNLNDIVFCSEEVGYIIGNNGTILKTTDSGVTWQQINVPYTQNLNTIAAIDVDNLWIVGDKSLILHSTDEGETWEQKNVLSENKNLYDIKFKGNIGYITGEQGCILKTENQGVDWEDKSLVSSNTIRSLSITGSKVFVLSFPYSNDYFASSTLTSDDGEHWSEMLDNGQAIWGGVCMHFTDDNQGFRGMFDYTTGSGFGLWIRKTIDGGDSWEETDLEGARILGGPSFKSNFSFSENSEFAYFLCGQILLRSPYTGELTENHDNINQLSVSKLRYYQNGDDLQIIYPQKAISSIRLISVSGVKMCENYGKNYIRINL